MAGPLTKVDDEAVERTRQLFVFNQVAVVTAMIAGVVFYVVWVDSPLLVVGVVYLGSMLVVIEWAKRRLRIDTLARIGVFILGVNWMTAVVLTLIVPFTFPLGILQILSPVIAAGPVLERPALLRSLAGALVLTATVTVIGLNLSDTEIEDGIPEGVATGVAAGGVAVMCVPIALGTWDAHERQTRALQSALESNVLIRDSRRRLVRAADDERRRIERDLHDGAQQQIVAATMRLRLRRSEVDDSAALDPIITDLEAALEGLRDLAHGIYPPLLRSRGLGEALAAAARRSPLTVTTAVAEVDRFEPEIEAAVYFCCIEALQNAAKHAGADAAVHVQLGVDGDRLVGSVSDTGPGFDDGAAANGVGLRNMEDRIGAVGGTLQIDGSDGTTVDFGIPIA